MAKKGQIRPPTLAPPDRDLKVLFELPTALDKVTESVAAQMDRLANDLMNNAQTIADSWRMLGNDIRKLGMAQSADVTSLCQKFKHFLETGSRLREMLESNEPIANLAKEITANAGDQGEAGEAEDQGEAEDGAGQEEAEEPHMPSGPNIPEAMQEIADRLKEEAEHYKR